METYSKEFALFIDGIRLERGISRIDLIDDIISLSQYKRYLRGATAIPNNVVIQLADKLKYNITDFYSIFTKRHSREYNQLMNIYNMMKLNKFEESLQMCQEIKYELIVSSFNKLFYDFCFIFTQHKLGRVSNIHVLSIYSELINYPNCMNNDSFNMIEMNILAQIVVISSAMDNFGPATSLYEVITAKDFDSIYSGDSSILPLIYYTTARVFYRQEKYEETKTLTNEGIRISLKHESINSLPHLLLINSLVYKQLGNRSKALESIRKCFLQLIIIGKPEVIDTFKVSYETHFDIPLTELLKDISDLI